MYEIAISVAACLRSGTRVDVAWAVQTHGFSEIDHTEALALTPGGGRIGAVLSGSANDALADLAVDPRGGRLVEISVSSLAASLAGLSCGGDARCLIVPATELPAELWDHLLARDAVCLVSELDGTTVTATAMFTGETMSDAPEAAAELFGTGISNTALTDTAVITVLWPVPTLLVVGQGMSGIAGALDDAAGLLGWQTKVVSDANAATGIIAALAVLDCVVVLSHDTEIAGQTIEAALSSEVGYLGALGSRRTQQARRDWLADRGITDVSRLYGPAGLDVGANTPAEIAVSILAEALAVRTGSVPLSLSRRDGPIH